jgi:group I intron endonuclease
MNQVAFVYKITNLLDGRLYIGVSKNPEKRFYSHAFHNTKTRSLIKLAIQKHGVENFKMDVLLKSTQEYCYMMERVLVDAYQTQKPLGYNICSGGRGAIGLAGEENGMFGKKGELHHNFGKQGYRTGVMHSEETKAKMSAAHKGKIKSPETIEKMREITRNRSPEMWARMRELRRQTLAKKREELL